MLRKKMGGDREERNRLLILLTGYKFECLTQKIQGR